MEWIKKNPHQLALALASLGLLGVSAAILLNTQSFGERFSAADTSEKDSGTLPPLELGPVNEALQRVDQPTTWTPDPKTNGSLFVANRYLIDPSTGKPVPPTGGEGLHTDPSTKQRIPNDWFLTHNLNLLDPNVPGEDPDQDGFSNADEWRGNTDPHKKESHPAYHTKLFVKQFIRVPFRLRFNAYDGDPKKDAPDKMSFQINTLDLRQPSEFLRIGEKVSRTNFRIEKFQYKTAVNPSTGVEADASELTLVNVETGETTILVLERVIDSPDSFALFTYTWPNPPQDIRVKKLGEFVLRPNINARYKLIDINDAGAQIQLPSGEKFTVPRL